jgi:glycerol uptake facilitator-like aquaporin
VTTAAVAPERVALVGIALLKAALAELVATAFLLIAVVGSGIAAERLCGGNLGLTLLANAIATGGALLALILAFGPRSGAHLNPAVTLASALTRHLPWRAVPAYLMAQLAGAVGGVWLAHLMFELPILQLGQHPRTGAGQWLAEAVATFGLLAVIGLCRGRREAVTAGAVAAYISGAYWFTASTAFANPAVTIARALTDSFAGIRPIDAPGFILAQGAGAALAVTLLRVLVDEKESR